MRWRIERDYQELKDELGLNHYEGRNWRGFHHHVTLCIAAYAYLVAQRIKGSESNKKTLQNAKNLPYPTITSLGVLQRSQRHVKESIASLHWQITQSIAVSLRVAPAVPDTTPGDACFLEVQHNRGQPTALPASSCRSSVQCGL